MIFEGKEVKVLLARAGAGKTSNLINIIAEELKTRRPEEIAFVTFTRKGAEEGLRRTCDRFMLTPEELPYFRTLHSLTFHALNLNAKQMFGRLHQRAFNKQYGYSLNRCEVDTGKVPPTKETTYLDFYDLERSGALTSKQLAEADIELRYYHQLVSDYEEYKVSNHLVDFFDCLIKYVRAGVSLPCKVIIIDECQDITMLQWQVINHAFCNAEKVYIAGDSEQSIYKYSGARPDCLIKLSQTYPTQFLSASYRIPKKVYELSKGIIDMISEKSEMPFDFKEGNPEGSVSRVNDIDRVINLIDSLSLVNSNNTQWFILSRNNIYLEKAYKAMEQKVIPYWTSDGFFMSGDIITRICDYEGFKLEGYKDDVKKKKFMDKFGITDFSKPFTDTNLFTEERKWVYNSYIEKFGLDKLKEMCKWNPQILVSTIHHVKGAEAENVAVLLDATRKTKNNLFNDIDEELRILYVAVTRAKRNLFLVDSTNGEGYDEIINTIIDQNGLDF